MLYTARYAHLESIPDLQKGEIITPGMVIGEMGDTGCSTGPHLHLDVVRGHRTRMWRLNEMGILNQGKKVSADLKQLLYCTEGVFKKTYSITTVWDCPDYLSKRGVRHLALDLIPTGKDWSLIWSRSFPGHVLKTGFDRGYGNFILIGFEA